LVNIFPENLIQLSADTKNKFFIERNAISKYVKNNRYYFDKKYDPKYFDHDFPLMSRLKINVTGFLELESTGN